MKIVLGFPEIYHSTVLIIEKIRLKNILTDFSSLDLTPSHPEKKDIIGDAYEFLIANFASDVDKKAS